MYFYDNKKVAGGPWGGGVPPAPQKKSMFCCSYVIWPAICHNLFVIGLG